MYDVNVGINKYKMVIVNVPKDSSHPSVSITFAGLYGTIAGMSSIGLTGIHMYMCSELWNFVPCLQCTRLTWKKMRLALEGSPGHYDCVTSWKMPRILMKQSKYLQY